MRIALVTDSVADLPEAERQELKVDAVPLYVHFQDKIHKDWVEITPGKLFEAIRAGAAHPSTSQPSPDDFNTVYTRLLKDHDHVISIHISAVLSGTLQSANLAAQSHPGKVTLVDSKSASLGTGNLVRLAARLRDQGRSVSEIVSEVEKLRDATFVAFSVASLEFLKRGGRIGGAQALLGSLLNIKPVLTLKDGKVDTLGKARGQSKAVAMMVDHYRAHSVKVGPVDMHYIYGADPEAVYPLQKAIDASGIAVAKSRTYEFGGVIGVHTGPGTYGAFASPALK